MVDENELLELCQYIVSLGNDAGVTAIEALAKFEDQIDTDIELSQITGVNKRVGTGIAIRLYLGKRMGSAFTNIPTKESVCEAVDLALAAAKFTTEDTDWIDLPHPQEYSSIEGLWDNTVTESNPGEMVALTGSLIAKGDQSEPGTIIAGGGSAVYYGYSAYANSNGVACSEKATGSFIAEAAIAHTESGTTPMVVEYDIKRGLDVDVDGTVKNVADQIRLLKNSVDGKTGKFTVIIHPRAYSQLFTHTLMEGIRGDNVARGKSKIADKIGDEIASKIFSLVDDGLHPTSAATSIADDEGVPRQRTKIVDKGILRSFLWDTYWANKMEVKSTGNASRNMRQGLVEIRHSTLVVEPGNRDIEEIISEIEHGYYIRSVQGAHSSNPESGDFSVVGNPAILIENGKLVGGVNGLMISGNIFDLLMNVKEVAKQPIALFSWIGPEIVVKDLDVIAKS